MTDIKPTNYEEALTLIDVLHKENARLRREGASRRLKLAAMEAANERAGELAEAVRRCRGAVIRIGHDCDRLLEELENLIDEENSVEAG